MTKETEKTEMVKGFKFVVDTIGKRKLINKDNNSVSPNDLLFHFLEKEYPSGLTLKALSDKITRSPKSDKAFNTANKVRIAKGFSEVTKVDFIKVRTLKTLNYYIKEAAAGFIPAVLEIISDGKNYLYTLKTND